MTDQFIGHYKLWEGYAKKYPLGPFQIPPKWSGGVDINDIILDDGSKIVAEKEEVNHPSHYGGDTTYETIKVLEAKLTRDEFIGFCKGSAIRYLDRAKHKGFENKDYKKAVWYLIYMNDYIERTPYESHNS